MFAKSPRGDRTSQEFAATAASTIPLPPAGKAPATPLSGAFAAAVGKKPKMNHSGPQQSSGTGEKKPSTREGGALRIKDVKSSAPILPRQGHR